MLKWKEMKKIVNLLVTGGKYYYPIISAQETKQPNTQTNKQR